MEELKLKVITFNVGDKGADEVKPEEMFTFLDKESFDFVFIGLQEVVNDATWTAMIKRHFSNQDYVLFKVRNIWAIWLYGLVKRSHLQFMDNVESEVTASGYAGVMGNKGGVSIRFKYQNVNLVVVNSHFTAHEEGFKDRLNDYLDIVSGQTYRDPEVSSLLDHDFVFWMGDLNFRIEKLSKSDVETNIKKRHFSPLIDNDQLLRAIRDHSIFEDFQEGTLSFPPTFKFDDNCDVYDTSKKSRKPAWTDRILYMCHDDDKTSEHKIRLLKYDCERNVRGSDHRPVYADFKISFKMMDKVHLPIIFDDISGTWRGDKDEKVSYKCLPINYPTLFENDDADNKDLMSIFKPDKWDWIGLVPASWTILSEDLLTYFYVNTSCTHDIQAGVTVDFSKKYLQIIYPKMALQVVYFSKRKNCIQGLSKVFNAH